MKNELRAGGLWCHQVLQALDEWVENSLDEDTRLRVREHVGSCGRCARFGARYARLVETLGRTRDAGDDEKVPQELLERLVVPPER